LIAIPLSFVLSWFIGQYVTSIISGFALGVTLIAFFFVNNNLMAVILTSLIGFTIGLGMASTIPLTGDVFDEFAKFHRKRSEGIGYGFLSMFSSLTIFLGNFIILLVRGLTGFIDGGDPLLQPPSAIMGVRMYTSMIPGVIIIAIMILFTILFDLKRNKTEVIRTELKRLEI
jgi:Na+/melibiose symporter-like transporter